MTLNVFPFSFDSTPNSEESDFPIAESQEAKILSALDKKSGLCYSVTLCHKKFIQHWNKNHFDPKYYWTKNKLGLWTDAVIKAIKIVILCDPGVGGS